MKPRIPKQMTSGEKAAIYERLQSQARERADRKRTIHTTIEPRRCTNCGAGVQPELIIEHCIALCEQCINAYASKLTKYRAGNE